MGGAGCVRVPCVGAVARDDAGHLLLVRRGNPPGKGLWSLPGGRVEPAEGDHEALVREVREETGLHARTGPLLGTVRRAGGEGVVYEIRDYAVTVFGGSPAPGGDAVDARWVAADELDRLPLTEGLREALDAWDVTG